MLRNVELTTRPGRWALSMAVAAAVALGLVWASSTFGAGTAPAPRIDLRVLLLSATGKEPSFGAWKAELTREGVPFDAKVADGEAPFTDATFADYATHHARYQAVILATGDLVHQVSNADGTVSYPSALADGEWAALEKFEATFGIRQFSDSTLPSPAHGLDPAMNAGEQGGNTGQLTAAGLGVFPYLKGSVPIENPTADTDVFGYQARPAPQASPAAFQTLVSGPNGSAYLGIYTHADGREELVSTLDGNENQLHAQLLRHGVLDWVTRGVHLGYQRNYFAMEVDDIFLPNDRWDTTLKRTLVDGPTTAPDEVTCAPAPAPSGTPACDPIRMVPSDVSRLLDWQKASGTRLDMVFNGGGSEEFRRDDAGADPLADALLANVSAFHWINHTFTHLQLDALPQSTIVGQIRDNVAWAKSRGIPVDPQELVSGEHSGLHNQAMPAALASTGVRWIAADDSREPRQYAVGSAQTVPRHPTNVYYNVATTAGQLDEYNYNYLPPSLGGRCVASATNTCRTAPATWSDFVNSEADIIFRHAMNNDPRPHYAHESNLAQDGVLYPVLDEFLRRYRLYFAPEPVQLSLAEAGQTLQWQAAWSAALAAGQVEAYLLDGHLHVNVPATMEVPITGGPDGEPYGGDRSGWTTVSPQAPLTQAVPPSAIGPPATGAVAGRGGGTGGAASPAPAPGTRPPTAGAPHPLRLRRLRLSPSRFTVADTRSTARRRNGRPAQGTFITWVMDEPATVHLSIRRIARKRLVSVTTLTRAAHAGENTIRFSGRIGRRPLVPGRYRAVVRAGAPDGRQSPATALEFRIVAR